MLPKRMGGGNRSVTGLYSEMWLGQVAANDDVNVTGIGGGGLFLNLQTHGKLL